MLSVVPPLSAPVTDLIPHRGLPGALSDGVTDALLTAGSPLGRSETVCRLVFEVFESTAWLGDQLLEGELRSLRGVLDAVTAHHVWVTEHSPQPGFIPEVGS